MLRIIFAASVGGFMRKLISLLLIAMIALLFYYTIKINNYTRDNIISKTFANTKRDDIFMKNREGYIIKVSDHMAIMKLNNEDDELLLVENPDRQDFVWKTVMKAEIQDWKTTEDNTLEMIVVEHDEEKTVLYSLY